jgi:hypothetical protein
VFRLRCPVPGAAGHPLWLGPGALDGLPALWRPEWRVAALVADRTVLRLHGAAVLGRLRACARTVRVYEVPPGERHKSVATWLRLADRMLADRLDRTTGLVALGGGEGQLGVAGDEDVGVPFPGRLAFHAVLAHPRFDAADRFVVALTITEPVRAAHR